MKDRPTPETDEACNEVYAQGVAHIPLVEFMKKLERERDEALNEGLEQARLLGMSGSREAKLISERDEARAELEQAKQDAKQHEVDCLRALGERNEARAEVQAIQHWATVNGTIQMQREIDEARKERDEALRLLGKWEQVAIGAGERVLELTKQREKLAQTLQSLQVACFRIGRGDVNDVGVAVAKMRQKALEALS